ncbi:MAG: ATP-binding protein [Candidatus Parvarchaeota archaeon]|jgi:ABC-type lipoprotein export system ATPase subunit|nr:ATP-binding protein [Candidatus Parvarchaeota archaeon]MCL5107156.1 ATP-binding protein [Candidatus Parvarchaeota archaeon]
MTGNNPFISITYSENDTVVDRVNERIELLLLINESMDHGGVVVLKGAPGMGKSTLLNAVEKELKKSKSIDMLREEFTPAVYNKIRNLNLNQAKKLLIELDDFNNIEMLDKLSQQRVIDLLYNLSQKAAVLIIENREEGVEKELKMQSKQFKKYQLEGLSKEDLKQIIINRLNSIRTTKSDSLEPFTEVEYEKIYRKSRGNPRIALLICSALYDQKTNSII